jgi:hypothetical protein
VAATYTTLEDLRRVMNSSNDKKVRFSVDAIDSIVAITSDRKPNKDIQIDTTLSSVQTSFQGAQTYRFEFTDDTNFNVYLVGNQAQSDYREVLIGTGDKNTDYTSPDGNITIGAGTFSGTIELGDSNTIKLNCDVSDDNACLYIRDAEIEIDSSLSEYYAEYTPEAQDTIYTAVTTPSQVKLATTYLAAYYLYSDMYVDVLREGDSKESFLPGWKKRAERIMNSFIKFTARTNPSVLSYPRFIDRIGNGYLGPGWSKMSRDTEELSRDAEVQSVFEGEVYTDGE